LSALGLALLPLQDIKDRMATWQDFEEDGPHGAECVGQNGKEQRGFNPDNINTHKVPFPFLSFPFLSFPFLSFPFLCVSKQRSRGSLYLPFQYTRFLGVLIFVWGADWSMTILPPILLCIANRLKDLPPGETIPVKLCVLMKLHPTSLGPKPWLGPRQMALATRATLVLPPELVCSMALGLPPMLVPLALVSHKKLKKQQAFLSFAFRCFDWLFLVFIFSFPSLATSSNNSVGAIVGPIVGVLCFLALVIGVAIFLRRRKQEKGLEAFTLD